MTGRLGIIAGAGELPKRIAAHANATGREVFVLGLRGFAEKALMDEFDGAEAAMGEIGKGIRLLSEAGCKEIVFAGAIKRPDLSALKFDLRGTALIPQLAAAAGKGDDALLRVVLNAFEKAGFKVIGADDVLGSLLAPAGPLGSRGPADVDWPDIRAASLAALELGAQDVAQGAVARAGIVIAREAQDGTDAMLGRLASDVSLGGVLVKLPKPQQERRIDLPTIGVQTVEGVARAGLAGIAVEAGAALVIDQAQVAAAADRLGVFVYGCTKAQLG